MTHVTLGGIIKSSMRAYCFKVYCPTDKDAQQVKKLIKDYLENETHGEYDIDVEHMYYDEEVK